MLEPWIKLEKSLLLGGQGKEGQSLHFLFHPKPQELGDRSESGIQVLIAHGKSTQLVPFWFMSDIACLWFQFQVITEESGGEWVLLYKFSNFFLLLLHNVFINYACHLQRVRKAFMKEIVCVPLIY